MISFLTKIKLKDIFKILLNPKLIVIRVLYALKRLFYDLFYFFIRDKYRYKIIFLAGMPMSATTKLKNMCGRIDGYFTRHNPTPEKIWLNQDITNQTFKHCPSWGYSLLKTHLNPKDENIETIKRNRVKKVIVSYRDLRDVVVARYYRLLNFPKKKNEPNYLEEIRQYKNISKSEGINDCIEKIATLYTKWIYGWFDIASKHKNFILFCKFEDLVSNPKEQFKKILDFYEISMSDSKINSIVKETEGKKNMQTNFGEAKILPWALSSNFRSGKIGNWRDEFDTTNIRRFKELAGESLIRLKYEKDFNW